MPDITMCQDSECPNREFCRRFTAEPSVHWQSYFMDTPRSWNDECTYFWNNGKPGADAVHLKIVQNRSSHDAERDRVNQFLHVAKFTTYRALTELHLFTLANKLADTRVTDALESFERYVRSIVRDEMDKR